MEETGRREKGKEEMFQIHVQCTMVFNDLIVKAVGGCSTFRRSLLLVLHSRLYLVNGLKNSRAYPLLFEGGLGECAGSPAEAGS